MSFTKEKGRCLWEKNLEREHFFASASMQAEEKGQMKWKKSRWVKKDFQIENKREDLVI